MKRQTFTPQDYDVFAGLDVDKRSISVTFTNHEGFIRSLRMPYSVEHLLNHVRKHFPDQKVAFAYEAGTMLDLGKTAMANRFTHHTQPRSFPESTNRNSGSR